MMYGGFSALLLLSSELQQLSESPITHQHFVTSQHIAKPRANLGILQGTQGDASEAYKVSLVYATHQKLPLDSFREKFLALGSNLGNEQVKPLFLAGDESTAKKNPKHQIIPATGQNCRVIAWLYVPHLEDFVLVSLYWHTHEDPKYIAAMSAILEKSRVAFASCIRFPGIISYIMPGGQQFNAGRFYLYSDWVRDGYPTLTQEKQTLGSNTLDDNSRHPNDRAVREWLFNIAIDRNQIFEHIMCMSEERFKSNYGLTQPNVENATRAIKKVVATLPDDRKRLFPKGFEKKFKTKTVCDLRKNIDKTDDHRGAGRLFVMRRSQYEYETDIRYLQSYFPDAVFQLASTLSCLEGGVKKYENPLKDMNYTPVQGENAVLATLPAAMVRRYCIEPYQRNLLLDVAGIFEGAERNNDPGITKIRYGFSYETLLDQSEVNLKIHDKEAIFQLALSGAMRVGVHEDVQVHSGSFDRYDISISRPDASFATRQVPAFDRWLTRPVGIHQIYTSALNLSKHQMKGKADILTMLHKNKDAIPRIVLRAMYEGTILAAYDLLKERTYMGKFARDLNDFLTPDPQDSPRMPRVFLTLVGAGAFNNEPEWIVAIIDQLQALIKKTNLQVCIVVWDFDKNAGWIKELESIARTINSSSLKDVSKNAKFRGERLWTSDNGNVVKTKVTLPIFKYDTKAKKKTTEKIVLPVIA